MYKPMKHPPLNLQPEIAAVLIEELKDVDYDTLKSGACDLGGHPSCEFKDGLAYPINSFENCWTAEWALNGWSPNMKVSLPCLGWFEFETESFDVYVATQYPAPFQPSYLETLTTEVAFYWKKKQSFIDKEKMKHAEKEIRMFSELMVKELEKYNQVREDITFDEINNLFAPKNKSLDRMAKKIAELDQFKSTFLSKVVDDKDKNEKIEPAWESILIGPDELGFFPTELKEWLNKLCKHQFTFMSSIIYRAEL